MKLGGGGNVQKTTQNSNSSIDATSQGRTASIWDAANQAGSAGQSPYATEAQGTFSGYQQGGNLGFAALTGDKTAAAAMMNPYQQQVIDANNAQAHDAQNAQLLSHGYDATMQQAAQAANLGFGAAQQNAQALSPEAYRLQMLKAGYMGPQGQSTSGAQTSASGGLSFKVGF